jgi:L-ribulose-5-phosphate 3-epimerase
VFRLGYNTNGLAHHRVSDGLRLLAKLGYRGVALTPDVGQLDPYRLERAAVREARALAEDLDLQLAVETGARFLLDPARKHFPTLLEDSAADRDRRLDFLRRSIDLAADLGAPLVSLWSGAAPGGVLADPKSSSAGREAIWERLCDGLRRALTCARDSGVRLAFEPEPGMFLERPAGFLELRARLGSDGEDLGLCLDVGHLLVTGDRPEAEAIRALGPHLLHVHLDDIRGGVHEHRMFGEGDLDLPSVLSALIGVGYGGMAAVELSRDSHRGPWAAAEALRRIRLALPHAT